MVCDGLDGSWPLIFAGPILFLDASVALSRSGVGTRCLHPTHVSHVRAWHGQSGRVQLAVYLVVCCSQIVLNEWCGIRLVL